MTKEEACLIIYEQDKSREEILKAIEKVESDCQELFHLYRRRIEEAKNDN